ncbi:MAG: class I SAM-dependent methyltransferase [Acidobacteriia bacterium]|nr:class I SAM-dependent methyltransferase [Terriglobia bacterium]
MKLPEHRTETYEIKVALGLTRTIFRLADNGDANSLASQLRANRFRLFAEILRSVPGQVRILDAGGTAPTWQRHRNELPKNFHVTLLNKEFAERPQLPHVEYVLGDARKMEMFPDRNFDVCFSNSLIEHLEAGDQVSFANEIRRVSQGYFVQTPNRYFPIEPHFLVPGWQFLPIGLRAGLLQQMDFGWMKRVPDPAAAREAVESIRLLNEGELQRLFADGQIHREKIGPLTKSLVAWRPICAKC